ncbi:MAG: hypothetical protein K2Z81_03460, partial [Cyanobacteria bacterium]|nr:hypothetical protein [Cyanobacteriota bacterium]
MVSSIASVQQPTISIPEVGTIDLSGYQVDAARWNEFQIFEISGESLKLVSELLGFSARFESDEVRTAWLDIFDSSARATLEVSRNARPHTLAVRYQADSWYSIDATPGTTERNTGSFSRADYESAKLENQSLNRLAEILGLEPDFQKSAFIRVNFKTMKVAVLSSSSDSGGAGTKPIEADSLNDGKVNDMETTSL